MLTALLFDLDGTLADTDPIHFQTWQAVLQEYGLEIDRPFYQANFSGRLNAAIIQDLLPQLSPAAGEALGLYKEAEFRQRSTTGLQRLAGLTKLLTWANNRALQQAVVTNAPIANAEFMLQVLGLVEQFPIVILGEELERGKPDPLPYQVALDQLGVPATAALAFEDSPSGIRAAVGAGITTIGMATTHSAQELYAVGASLVVPDFADPQLIELLERSLQPSLATSAAL
ncbi:HAD family hydrolase [Pantanalinema sp. GBBB05]|uniref:HAD family hydrolase n=1 Tax=Pantanalinema sp. GBBB05 TaxID=2604139 RepID=UPI001DC00355|nr:HAD-IA family hydrolase [Pantanalinema sp. GBBB05]